MLIINKQIEEKIGEALGLKMAAQKAVERLPYSDLKKISELSRNYGKLQRYSKLITKEQPELNYPNLLFVSYHYRLIIGSFTSVVSEH